MRRALEALRAKDGALERKQDHERPAAVDPAPPNAVTAPIPGETPSFAAGVPGANGSGARRRRR
jgi:hypothetical protein